MPLYEATPDDKVFHLRYVAKQFVEAERPLTDLPGVYHGDAELLDLVSFDELRSFIRETHRNYQRWQLAEDIERRRAELAERRQQELAPYLAAEAEARAALEAAKAKHEQTAIDLDRATGEFTNETIGLTDEARIGEANLTAQNWWLTSDPRKLFTKPVPGIRIVAGQAVPAY